MLSTTKLKKSYRIGDRIQAKVIERIDETDWIVSLEGTLIKVVNRTGQILKDGDMVPLRVDSLDPAKLTILG